MDLYGKKQYEELDFITKATEPYLYHGQQILQQLPNRIELTVDDLEEMVKLNGSVGYYMNLSTALKVKLKQLRIEADIYDYQLMNSLEKKFSFQSVNSTIDVTTNSMSEPIVITKDELEFSDADIKAFIEDTIITTYNRHNTAINDGNGVVTSRVSELCKLFDVSNGRTCGAKLHYVVLKFKEEVARGNIKIMDVDLASSITMWLLDYASIGNKELFKRLCKLKLMATTGTPIYQVGD